MRNFLLVLFTASLTLAGSAQADQLLNLTLDTSSLNGTVGSLDFAFDAGALATQAASVQLSNFSGATYANLRQTTGAVTGGPIASPITIQNSTATQSNDEFESVKFGSTFSFLLSFSGPAVNSPTGTSTSTSQFAFYAYSNAAGTVPALTSDPSGLLALVTVNTDGTLSTSAVSPNVTFAAPGAATPEPATFGLLAGALGLLGFTRLRRRA